MPNIRAAMRWDLDQNNITRAMDGAGRLEWFWTDPGFTGEGRALLESMLDRDDHLVPAGIRAKVLAAASSLANWQEDAAAAYEHAIEALRLWEGEGDDEKVMTTMLHIGKSCITVGNLDEAVDWLQRGHDLALRLGDVWYAAGFANLRGGLEVRRGDYLAAIHWHQTARRGWITGGYEAHVAMALDGLGLAWRLLGDERKAEEAFAQALEIHARGEASVDAAYVLVNIAVLHVRSALAVDATRLMAGAIWMRQELGVQFVQARQQQADAAIDVLHATIGPALFARAWSEGAAMSFEALLRLGGELLEQRESAHQMLTPREREVLALIVEGASDEEIASRLFIARRTASKHVGAILDKLGAANRTVAVTIAHRRGLV